MKKLLLTSLLLAMSAALAAPIKDSTITGKITDWPAGKAGELQLRLLDYLTDQKDAVLARTPIDAAGNFTLKLPEAAALTKVLPAKDAAYSYGGACQGSLELSPAAQVNFFDLQAFVDGKLVSNVKYRTSRTPWPWLTENFAFQVLAFSTAATKLDGAASCDLQNSPFYDQNGSRMRVETTASLAAGWNTLTGTQGSKAVFTDAAMPASAFWHVQIGYGGIGLRPGPTDDQESVQVLAVTPSGAAEAAGIKVGDLILTVDGRPVDPANVGAMAERVRGEEGTTVTLTVKRGEQTLTLPIKRQFVSLLR